MKVNRLYNPIFTEKFFKISIFWQKIDVWLLHNSSELTSLETKRRQEFVEEN
jgi:hypothetical protein